MRSDPHRLGDPALNLAVRPEQAPDAPFLYALFATSARAMLAPAGLPESALASLVEMQWRARSAAYASGFPNARGWIALQDSERVGRLLEGDVAAGVHIIDIAVAPAYQRRGIAAALVAMVMAGLPDGRDLGADVAVDNLASLGLFQSFGFTHTTIPGASHVDMRWRAQDRR